MKIINLSFKQKPKISGKLPERGFIRYKKNISKTDVQIIQVYSFILPEFEKHPYKEFSFFQSNKGLLDFSDNYSLFHFGNQGLDDFKVYVHYCFYGKMIDVVIFKKNDQVLNGILYNNIIYYEPDTYYYSAMPENVEYFLKSFNLNKKYILNELNEQTIYVDKYLHINEFLNIDINNYYFVKSLSIDNDANRYLDVNRFNMVFLKEFYVDETNRIAVSPINFVFDENVNKFKDKIDKFFRELKSRDKKMNVIKQFDQQYDFKFDDYVRNFEPSLLNLSDEQFNELKQHFELSKNLNYNL
jgi:hypothetical protein